MKDEPEIILIGTPRSDEPSFASGRKVLEPQQIGIVTISTQLLADLLHFPEGHKIIDVRRRPSDFASDTFQILCEGPTLPVTCASEYTPEVHYICTQTENTEKLVPQRKIEGKFLV